MNNNIKKDIYSGSVFLLFSVFVYAMSFAVKQSKSDTLGPQFFPRVIAVFMAGLSILVISKAVIALQKEKRKSEAQLIAATQEKAGLKINYPLLWSSLLLVVYVVLLKPLGFIIMSVIYLFCQIYLISAKEDLKKKNLITIAIISVVVPVALYLIFYYAFNIFLPPGFLG